jgi:large conductance mechanosensitive channel
MIKDFYGFLTRSNALALAIGVIIGAAVGKVVSALTDDILMPLVSPLLPAGNWREAKLVLSRGTDAAGAVTENAILWGHFLGTLLDFLIIALVIYLIMKALLSCGRRRRRRPGRVRSARRSSRPARGAVARARAW